MSFKKGLVPWNKGLKGVQIPWNAGRRIDKTCTICKNVFNIVLARRDTAKYCSRLCSYKGKVGKSSWNKGIKTGIIPKQAFKPKDPRIMGENNPNYLGGKYTSNWKGGRWLMGRGYIGVTVNKKYLSEHRYIVEQYLGRKLDSSEDVHHINGDRTDNRIDNLMVLNKSDHTKLHWRTGKHINASVFTAVRE